MKYRWKFVCVSLCLFFMFACSDKEKGEIVYVNSVKLFEEFKMKTEYDKVLERDLKAEAMLVDSIQTIMNHTTDSMEMYRLRKDYYIAEKLFNDKFEKLSATYTASVTERLDEYIKKYAIQKEVKMIVSGNNGGVIYVDETVDLTDELIQFANKEFDRK
jgi:outer membrane protein